MADRTPSFFVSSAGVGLADTGTQLLARMGRYSVPLPTRGVLAIIDYARAAASGPTALRGIWAERLADGSFRLTDGPHQREITALVAGAIIEWLGSGDFSIDMQISAMELELADEERPARR